VFARALGRWRSIAPALIRHTQGVCDEHLRGDGPSVRYQLPLCKPEGFRYIELHVGADLCVRPNFRAMTEHRPYRKICYYLHRAY